MQDAVRSKSPGLLDRLSPRDRKDMFTAARYCESGEPKRLRMH